ncbi:c-type cytochrome [Variovorax guangxiensis]|uniref:c-type cytochrome n=1 Tax=Variovorax guangxiensis TaxID=1775474 RepID=UPI0028634D58|nr:c-type cytochrome [Variovorax guangxiensis]MDR6859511.1 cytochrome c553 [Variovorax guangxiensis]
MMREPGMYSWINPWFRWSVSSVCAMALLSILVGFVWLPSVHGDFSARGIWDSICRAAGVPSQWGDGGSSSKAAGPRSTKVVLTQSMVSPGSNDAIGRGATIAVQQCSMCHGARGMSEADAPNLAGQYPEVVIKQLHDYKRGDRSSSIMQTLAQNLSDRDIESIAAYYDSLPRARTAPVRTDETNAPALVRVGDPLRNIAPCISCHGGIDHKLGTPWLEGMPKAYLSDQLKAFASGTRRNDSHGQMRNMARPMSSEEIDQVSDFYARRGQEAQNR